MPGTRVRRKYTRKQQEATDNRKQFQPSTFDQSNPDAGLVAIKFKNSQTRSKKDLGKQLNEYLINYDARLLEIDRKYPLGCKDRPELIVIHRQNAAKHILEMVLKSLTS